MFEAMHILKTKPKDCNLDTTKTIDRRLHHVLLCPFATKDCKNFRFSMITREYCVFSLASDNIKIRQQFENNRIFVRCNKHGVPYRAYTRGGFWGTSYPGPGLGGPGL